MVLGAALYNLILFFKVNDSGSVLVAPRRQRAYRGKTVEFRCISEENVKWVFLKEPKSKPQIPNAQTGVIGNNTYYLRISQAYRSHEGYYRCQWEHDFMIFYDDGQLFVASNQEKARISR